MFGLLDALGTGDGRMERTVTIPDAVYGFRWAENDGDRYLRNDAGDLRRVSGDAFELLQQLAAGSVDRADLPETASSIVDSLEANGFLEPNTPVVELHPPTDIRLWPRLLAFVALYCLALPVGMNAFGALFPLEQLLTPTTIIGVVALGGLSVAVHEAGHYFAARPFLDPDVHVGRLNAVIPAVITDTTGAWLLPQNRRLWITLAGPFAHLCLTWVLVACKLLWFPEKLALNAVIVGNLVQVLTTMNPLIHGDGYLLLVDLFGVDEPKTKGLEDLRERNLTYAAGYVVLSYGFAFTSMSLLVVVVALELVGS